MKNQIQEAKRFQKLAGLSQLKEVNGDKINSGQNRQSSANYLEELDSTTQGAIGMAVGGTITLAIAIKEAVSLYKKLKQQNPEISNKELIVKTLSSIANKIQNSK